MMNTSLPNPGLPKPGLPNPGLPNRGLLNMGMPPAVGARVPERSNAPLFEALVCETHHAAAMTAIVASCINGAAAGQYSLSRQTVDRYLPPEPAVLLLLTRRSLLEIEPLSETQERVEAFFTSLRVLRRMLGSYFFDASEIGAERAHVLHSRRVCEAASAACHEALRAVRTLEAETPGRLPDLYCDHAQALSGLLLAAEQGATPCLDGRGQPFMPNLPQRRRSMRRSLSQPCRVLYRRAILSAFAKDVSEGGIGLLRVPFLQTDDVVTVELCTGRRFKGIVAWCRDEAAGVRFLQSLPMSDPLLAL